MGRFIGRRNELEKLTKLFRRVAAGGRTDRPGRAVLMRGRRRVGKSRLAEEFVSRMRVPSFFFTAAREPLEEQLRVFVADAALSGLPGSQLFADVRATSWDSALSLLVRALPQDSPSIVVIDELPYMIESDPHLEGRLQRWLDRELSRLPVLLILIGSDLSVMEAINQYDRPFHMRATEMVVSPLTPHDIKHMLGLDAATAIDAHLVTGGLPLTCEEWPSGASLWDYLEEAVTDSSSALVISGERTLAAEFPADAHARVLLKALGAGERSYSSLERASGGMPGTTLQRALQILIEKRVVVPELPLSTRPSRERRYHLADPHLRFWLAFIGPHMAEIERGRGDLVMRRLRQSWTAWRGMAVEPLVRESLRRMDGMPEETGAIGSYWTRSNNPQIDLVGADREPVAKRITMAGSIKWLEDRPFDDHDLAELIVHRSKLPGADTATPMIAVSRGGCTAQGIRHISPDELVDAWA
ncbi:ATP-binding protein [Thermoactinospora rubra]|uniref:ATP-binding protein n=1 Tax=Thermoactinospora rubra TaxID=1088767 RepID=UPI000A10077D|nr:DUF234 domain-containing protein [Thermoactinospora rubra]